MAAKELDTTRNAVPFDRANIPGPKMAKAIQAEMAGKLISKARRPLLIIGTAGADDGVIDMVKRIAEKGIPVAATGNSIKRLKEEGIDATYVNLHALVSYLKDPGWKGFDGKGGYDTTIFLGHTYYYASQLMSTLKNFTNIKIISIDRHYHPNAQQSFGNLKPDDFLKALDMVVAEL
ncbi:MAG: CO dehydrogenase/acetyl-CoA synthase complex subunit epsilon [ANME-2 cluster archaeon]|nr:CO dehydrogenase/acetyl-CoA synthase complex subunit epsilon [ANME-2 cluster archaeon]